MPSKLEMLVDIYYCQIKFKFENNLNSDRNVNLTKSIKSSNNQYQTIKKSNRFVIFFYLTLIGGSLTLQRLILAKPCCGLLLSHGPKLAKI